MDDAAGRTAWDALEPDQQDALDRIWRGVDVVPEEALALIQGGLVVKDGEGLRLTDAGECLVLARLPALRAARRGPRGGAAPSRLRAPRARRRAKEGAAAAPAGPAPPVDGERI